MAERKKGFAPWNPKKPEILAILADIDTVLDEYRDDLPLTIRQIFYRLVGGFGYEKTEKFYSRIQDYLVLGRRSGRVPFSSIRDDGTTSRGGGGKGFSPSTIVPPTTSRIRRILSTITVDHGTPINRGLWPHSAKPRGWFRY